MNKVLLIGNVGQDPELRYTQGGQAVLNMRLATNESFLNRDNERQERTEWHTVIVWGKRAEALNKILSKGKQLCIEGRLQTRAWEDKRGDKRYSTEIVASNVILLGSGSSRAARSYDDDPPPPDTSAFDADDIPFIRNECEQTPEATPDRRTRWLRF